MVQVFGTTNKHHTIRHVHWDPPEGIIKVNVGGSSFGNPRNAILEVF